MSVRVKIDGTIYFDLDQDIDLDAMPELALSELNCTITVNAIGSARLGFPNAHFYRSALETAIIPYRSVVEIEKDGETLFRGRALLPSIDFYSTLSCPCESELAFLCDSVVAPGTYTGTPTQLFSALISAHASQADAFKQFSFGAVTVLGDSQSIEIKEACSSLAYLNELISRFGGCLKFGWTGTARTISWLATLGTNAQPIKFGVNLLDIAIGYSQNELATRVIPYGKATDGVRLVLPSPGYVEDQAAKARFGIISKAVVFSDAEDEATLRAEANAYLAEHSSLISSLSLRAVDLSSTAYEYDDYIPDTSSWEVGKAIDVISPPHGIDGRWQLVQRYFDLLKPSNDRITLGALPATLTGSYI